MARGAETRTVATWLYQTLSGDAQLRTLVTDVYDNSAPSTAVEPYVSFFPLTVEGINPVGPGRVGITGTWLVKVVGRTGEYDSLEPAARRIDELLHARRGRVSNGQVFSTRWERPFEMATREDGVDFRHLGAEYRVLAR